MSKVLDINRAIQQNDEIQVKDSFTLEPNLIDFFKKCSKNEAKLFWLNEMIEEEDISFFSKERVHLLENIQSVMKLTSDDTLLKSMQNLIDLITKAISLDQDLYIWEQ